MPVRCLPSVFLVLAFGAALVAAEPIGWRNDTSGAFPGASPPLAWSEEENVAWKAELPSNSNGSPIVVGERVFVCAEPTRLLCLSVDDGRVLWEVEQGYDTVLSAEAWAAAQRELEQGDVIRARLNKLREEIGELDQKLQGDDKNEKLRAQREALATSLQAGEKELAPFERYRLPERSAGCTTATPVSDGRRVYAVFGSGVVACFDLEGNRQWGRLLDKATLDWGHTASPLLVDGKLLVHLTDLVALDANNGETRWTAEVAANYGSPVVCRAGQDEVLVTSAGDVVRLSDGRVLAQGIAERLRACSPVAQGDTVYFIEGRARAVRLPDDLSGGGQPKTLWDVKLFDDNYYASPLLHDGLIYAVSENRVLSVLNAADGELVYEQRLRFKERGAVTSSLAAVGDEVLIVQENGRTKIIRAGREYDELAENPLESLRSSPVIADGRLFIRGSRHLYCIGR
jgi:outer membrane protein assembly factor BamB